MFFVSGLSVNKPSAFIAHWNRPPFLLKGLRIAAVPWLTENHCAQTPAIRLSNSVEYINLTTTPF